MKRAAVCSGILHLIILIVMIIGITDPFSRTLQDQHPLMIDFVDISEITKAPIISPMDVTDPEPVMETLQQDPEPTPQPVEQPPLPAPMPEPTPPAEPQKPEPKPEPAPIPTPEPDPEPVPAPKPEPIPQKIESLPKEPPKVEKKPDPAPREKEIKKPEPPKKEKVEVNLTKEEPKPKVNKVEETKEKKKIDDAFDSLLADVTKETKKKDPQKTSGRIKGAPAEREGEIVTASEIDAIRRLMQRCWIVPNGVRGVRNLQVKLKLNIAKDGTVKNAQVMDRGRMGSDTVFRAAAESAERAIMDPSCNPLPLNPAKYKQWQTMIMTFDPADMQ